MMLNRRLTLYHGSYCTVSAPELAKCQQGKDFGQGFYLTTELEQARRFVRNAIRKRFKGNSNKPTAGCVSVFEFIPDNALNIYEFGAADIEWLHCIASHRQNYMYPQATDPWQPYDIIYGKIANDTTNFVLTNYLAGAYGKVGSDAAAELAIRFLEPQNLKDQACFRTAHALRAITFVDSMEVSV